MNTKNTNSDVSSTKSILPEEKYESEAFFQACVLEYFRTRKDIYVIDTSILPRLTKGFVGQPDLIVCKEGKFIAIELKSAHGKLTQPQGYRMQHIRDAGGIAVVCYTMQDVIEALP